METFLAILQENIVAQIFWFVAMTIVLVWLWQKDDRNTIKIIICAEIFWIIHFYLLSLYSAIAWGIIWMIRLALSLKYKRNKMAFIWVMVAFLVVALTTCEWKMALLPIIGSSISAYWYFFLEWFKLRVLIFISSVFRLTFDIHSGSIWWAMNEILSQLVLIFVMYKLIRDEHKWINIFKEFVYFFRNTLPDVCRHIIIYDYLRILKKSVNKQIKVFFHR
jgi:hypothetical protein